MAHIEIDILNNCDKIICSANHHSKWLQRKGIKNVKYFPVTVMDHSGENWMINNERTHKKSSPPIITMIGNVTYTATLDGLYYFSKHILPGLNKLQAKIGFELLLYGDGELAPNLAHVFEQYPWIKRVGFVEDIRDAFCSSSIFLVPTSIPLGFRTRIVKHFHTAVV